MASVKQRPSDNSTINALFSLTLKLINRSRRADHVLNMTVLNNWPCLIDQNDQIKCSTWQVWTTDHASPRGTRHFLWGAIVSTLKCWIYATTFRSSSDGTASYWLNKTSLKLYESRSKLFLRPILAKRDRNLIIR